MAVGGLRAAVARVESFPGETAWRWQVQLRVERFMSPVRALTIAFTIALWLTRPTPPGASPQLMWLLTFAAAAYVPVDLLMVYRRQDLASRFPLGSAILDLVFIMAWVAGSGLHDSPYLSVLFLGAVTGPLRLPLGWSLLTSVAYAGAYAVMAPPGQWIGAGYLLLCGLIVSIRTAAMLNDRRLSLRDPLTGCFGRDYGLFQVEQLLARRAFPFAVGLLDLDGFKQVNDTYGHATGDQLLREVTRAVEASVRAGDLVARFGGDEFLIVWADADAAAACEVSERVRTRIEQTQFHLRTPSALVTLTASIGVAPARPGTPVAQLLKLADTSLYAAKQTRNRVEVSTAGTPEPVGCACKDAART